MLYINLHYRYNAEKTKVGMYYTTPIYQFRMKCHLCDNHIEMKTDPAVCILSFRYQFIFECEYFAESGLCNRKWCKETRTEMGPR